MEVTNDFIFKINMTTVRFLQGGGGGGEFLQCWRIIPKWKNVAFVRLFHESSPLFCKKNFISTNRISTAFLLFFCLTIFASVASFPHLFNEFSYFNRLRIAENKWRKGFPKIFTGYHIKHGIYNSTFPFMTPIQRNSY